MFRAYLVDDELPAVKRLTRLLQATGRVEIVGAEMNPVAAVEAIRAASPDILFLDIQMPGLTGFDLLARVERQPFVIFTTAYDQYALKAFEVNSIDYLLKPVEPEELDRALNKLEQFQRAGGQVDLRGVLEALSRSAAVQRIPIRMGERTRFLDVGRITHFFTQGRLTFAACWRRCRGARRCNAFPFEWASAPGFSTLAESRTSSPGAGSPSPRRTVRPMRST